MAEIELVIKIPESEIPKQQDIIEIPLHFIDGKVCEAGGYEFDVLPKGHGRIVDVSKIDEDRIDHNNPIIYLNINGEYIEAVSLDYINNLPTIIPADTEDEE